MKTQKQEIEKEELMELLTNLTTNQNEMAKKIVNLSNVVIELQEIIKGGSNGKL